ncbi:unnamed protein product [Peniophora sp. CBMAI 1063]|nr:unnamed protein product [Peniophora sp. CBMAI 1063]
MSTVNLLARPPSYDSPPQIHRTPSYAREPRAEERRLAQGYINQRTERAAEFVKQNKTASIVLRLGDQVEGVEIPSYGMRAPIDGVVELSKPDGLAYVSVKVEGTMKLHEFGEGGMVTATLCSETVTLWRKGIDPGPCPDRLDFSISLPTQYSDEKDTYPLPPTFEAHLSGLPGFHADVEYHVTAIASKTKLPLGKLNSLGQSAVSTPFIYSPRTCPSSPLPAPLRGSGDLQALPESSEWKTYDATVTARTEGARSVSVRFLVPKSHVFCKTEPIPFHVSFVSSAVTLASMLPYLTTEDNPSGKSSTRIQLLRQVCVNVKDEYLHSSTNTELWKVQKLGEGTLRRGVDGPRMLSFSGEINIDQSVKSGAFKAGGLWVKDFIVFQLNPSNALKGPIGDARIIVPVRLVTDPYSANTGTYIDTPPSRVSPPESVGHEDLPTLDFNAPLSSSNSSDSPA